MPNRLARETSPYLLQHQNNPVDWFPWGDEAFAKAAAEDKPVFLSVGYSSCHWCHVMEHESFEDAEIAAFLNEHFVSVKVDREERPDVDEAYMIAVQLSAGRGGWPMSVILTPDRRPFFAGTYFPKEDRDRFPGFSTVLRQIEGVWRTERGKVDDIAGQFAQAMRDSLTRDAPPVEVQFDRELIDEAVRKLTMDFDEEQGGFGGAPKFPPHTAVAFLLEYALLEDAPDEMRQAAADMALFTLEKMSLGGLHDHVGGGFHRYSTDGQWRLPHFEKMLYDNALMLANYVQAAAMCHGQLPELEQLYAKTADGIIRWLNGEMTSPEGLYYSALDADSEGEEGKYYVWTSADISEVLGQGASAFIDAFDIREGGNFHDEATGELTGANIPVLSEDVGDRFDLQLRRLHEARKQRVRPGLDDKVLVGWNGLLIAALAEAAELEPAERAAEAILGYEKQFGQLPHQIAKGQPSGAGYLEDYAYFIDGLLTLANSKSLFEEISDTFSGRSAEEWLNEADRLMQVAIARFYDEERGGFFATSDGHEQLFGRSKPVLDQPLPSANAIAIRSLLAFGDDERARKSFEAFLGWMSRAPSATEALYHSALYLSASDEDLEEPVKGFAVITQETLGVSVQMPSRELVASNGVASGLIVLEVPPGFHVNSSEPPARWLIPTRVSVQPVGFTVSYPAPVDDRYEGRVEIPFTVKLPAGKSEAEFEVRVSYQACTETECLAPEEKAFDAVVRS